jgi:hypothetical protein
MVADIEARLDHDLKLTFNGVPLGRRGQERLARQCFHPRQMTPGNTSGNRLRVNGHRSVPVAAWRNRSSGESDSIARLC